MRLVSSMISSPPRDPASRKRIKVGDVATLFGIQTARACWLLLTQFLRSWISVRKTWLQVLTYAQPDNGPTRILPVRLGEEHSVMAVARELFHGYLGDYHADDRLDRAKCDELYTSWAYCSCVSREVADEVFADQPRLLYIPQVV